MMGGAARSGPFSFRRILLRTGLVKRAEHIYND